MTLPMVPYADAGPLYGLVWPILISVAVTPTVWASTGPATSAVVSATATAVKGLFARMVSSFGVALSNPSGHGARSGAPAREPRQAEPDGAPHAERHDV